MSEATLSEFLDMGGYGAYIWPVYGLAAVLMLGLFIQSYISWRQNEAELTLLKSVKSKKPRAPKSLKEEATSS